MQAPEQLSRLPQDRAAAFLFGPSGPAACSIGQPRLQTARVRKRLGEEKRLAPPILGATLAQGEHLRSGDVVPLQAQQKRGLPLFRRSDGASRPQPGERFQLMAPHQMNTIGTEQNGPVPSHRNTSCPSLLAARKIIQHRFAEALMECGSDTQRLAGQANPCLRFNGRLSLFVNVPPCP
jgi:hypothetical protein